MIGLGWRKNTFGDRVTIDDIGQGRPHVQGRRTRLPATGRRIPTRS